MSANIGVILGTTRLEVAAGSSAEISLTVRNLSQIVDHYIISIEGLDPTWWNISVPTFSLFPNDQGEAKISVHPPKEAEARAGGYSFRIKATSKADPQDFTTVEALLILKGFILWDIEMTPSKVTGKSGTYNIKINNLGNTDAVIVLEAKDPEEALAFQFSQSTVTVPGGGSARAKLDVKPKGKGEWKKLYNFQVTSTPSDTKQPQRESKVLNGQLEYPKKGFPWWILIVLLVLLLLAVGAFIVWKLFFEPMVTVISPRGGEAWISGSTHTVSWTTRGSSITAVKIELSRDGGLNWNPLEQNGKNDGVFPWLIDAYPVASGDCLIRITALDKDNKTVAKDISANRFSVSPPATKPSVTLTYPSNTVKLSGGSKVNITWTAVGSGIATVNLYYSTNGGSAWTLIQPDQPNSLQYEWTVPNTAATACKVKIVAYDSSKKELSSDTSNSNFTIEKSAWVMPWYDLKVNTSIFEKLKP
ncbi:MAG: hypothetical protein NTZ34_06695 [Chloroflexi bacterium]|nr:hypothetical protein [Chloroflexota bacterium]